MRGSASSSFFLAGFQPKLDSRYRSFMLALKMLNSASRVLSFSCFQLARVRPTVSNVAAVELREKKQRKSEGKEKKALAVYDCWVRGGGFYIFS